MFEPERRSENQWGNSYEVVISGWKDVDMIGAHIQTDRFLTRGSNQKSVLRSQVRVVSRNNGKGKETLCDIFNFAEDSREEERYSGDSKEEVSAPMSINIMCWNIRGLGNAESFQSVQELKRKLKPNLILIQQTKIYEENEDNIIGVWRYPWEVTSIPALERSRGISVAWNSKTIEVLDSLIGDIL
ncbi:hypothetical protein FRX31_013852 [Thalictrum thalictroides]|uniref:Uncharacterized protein n=1 Tax=Thalictrum thalictroides TaxID=46969 RepID=A0A7J6WGU5_THATH|nr:hypothetical protein FRX31_013852 [Thalictrum thalictroides]